MNKINWSKWSSIAEIISSLAIVITLIYLSIQTKQNNELLEAQARAITKNNKVEYSRTILSDDRLNNLLVKTGFIVSIPNHEDLSPEDSLILLQFSLSVFFNWEWEYQEAIEQRIDIPVNAWLALIELYPLLSDTWVASKNSFLPEFQKYIDNNIIQDGK